MIVAVPEASVNEDDLAMPGKYEIGLPRQESAVKSKAIAQAM